MPSPTPYDRKLVTLRRVVAVTNLPNRRGRRRGQDQRDRITIDGGWGTVEPRGHGLAVGDVAVYFEIDSFVPSSDGNFWEEIAAAGTEFDGKLGYLIKTRRVQGHVSQGRVFPLRMYPAIRDVVADLQRGYGEVEGMRRAMELGFDEVLGVVKWEVAAEQRGLSYGPPPGFFRRTGAVRVQHAPYLFDRYFQTKFQISEKLDGVPLSIYYVKRDSAFARFLPEQHRSEEEETQPGRSESAAPSECGTAAAGTGRVGVCTRNEDLVPTGGSVAWEVVNRLGIPAALGREDKSVVVQGELCGPSILNNSLGYSEGDEHEFYAFQVWDVEAERYMHESRAAEWLERLRIPQVPVLGYRRLCDMAADAQELLALAGGTSVLPGRSGCLREGLVLKNWKADVCFKVISNEWLLKHQG